MEEKLERDFKGVWIPREIYLREDLSWTEKILLIEVNSLDRGDGCFASNLYLAKFLNISESRVADILTNLRKKGLIVNQSFDGRKRYMKVVQPREFLKTGTLGSLKQEHSNTVNNKVNVNEYVHTSSEDVQRANPSLKDVLPKKNYKEPVVVPAENVNQAINYYLASYKRLTGQKHPRLVPSKMKEVIEAFNEVGELNGDSQINFNGWREMIDDWFKLVYSQDSQVETDWNILHFISGHILQNRYYNTIARHI